ncbi:hypothetical protein POSPLADRAFT_1062706 [Postia placenta MAD-698-R-SB12]|uniref:Uncharacterized protein n=1 Tax=Postia placenta MAD-698-R-SB12 TaxID=670580 RepID=A0A1X6MJK5_9APHY|nr:hypothetical protein POSPLADRAFT_1062706 [Postia placenta MAD-698-R-SB12]OSX56564.1 hypothetical protein POSPLADRAFT_1062706 [Postia placenta MAD-698-R-SB12]
MALLTIESPVPSPQARFCLAAANDNALRQGSSALVVTSALCYLASPLAALAVVRVQASDLRTLDDTPDHGTFDSACLFFLLNLGSWPLSSHCESSPPPRRFPRPRRPRAIPLSEPSWLLARAASCPPCPQARPSRESSSPSPSPPTTTRSLPRLIDRMCELVRTPGGLCPRRRYVLTSCRPRALMLMALAPSRETVGRAAERAPRGAALEPRCCLQGTGPAEDVAPLWTARLAKTVSTRPRARTARASKKHAIFSSPQAAPAADEATDNEDEDSMDDNAATSSTEGLQLTSAQQLRLLMGYYRLSEIWEKLRKTPLNIGHSASCSATWHQHGCTQSWLEFWKGKTRCDAVLEIGPADVPGRLKAIGKEFERWGSATYMHHDCRMTAKRKIQEKAKEIEDALPEYFVG